MLRFPQAERKERHTLNRVLWILSVILGIALVASAWNMLPEPGPAENTEGVAGSLDAEADPAAAGRGIATSRFREATESRRIGEGLTLRVVGADQRVVEAAEVRFMASDPDGEQLLREAMLAYGWDRIPLLERHGEKLLTDAAGEVRLPRFHSVASVAARHGDLWSMLDLREGMEGPVLLVLRASPALKIEVVDAAGKPASHVPVTLRSVQGTEGMDLWRGTSDANGVAVIQHVADVAQQDRLEGTLLLAPGFPCGAEFARTVDLRTDLAKPVRLTVPPLGSLTVRVESNDGSALPRGSFVTVTGVDGVDGEVSAQVIDNVAHISALAVGVAVQLRGHTSERWRPCLGNHAGPSLPGEVANAALRFDAEWPALSAQLVEENGTPAATQSFNAHLLSELGLPLRSFGVRTDAVGKFRCDLPSFGGVRCSRLEVTRVERDTGSVHSMAFAPLSQHHPDGVTLLGTLILQPAPRVVSGTVVDTDGLPLRGTLVEVELRTPTGVWLQSHELRCESGVQGAYEIRGPVPAAPLRLRVQRERWRLLDAVPFTPGSSGVRLVLERLSSVVGQVIVDAIVDPRQIEVALEPRGGGVPVAVGRPGVDGRFFIEYVPQGTWRCTVTAEGGHSEIVVIPDVVVRVGGDDPRLSCIDLRGRCRGIAVDVVDEAGQAIDEAWVHVAAAGRGAWRRARDGHLEVVLGAAPLTLTAQAPGLRTVRTESVIGDTRMVLPRGVRVRLELADLPPKGTRLHATLVAVDAGVWPQRASAGGINAPAFDAAGVLHVALAHPGRWRARFTLTRPGSDAAVGLRASAFEPFEVHDTKAEQVIRIRLSAEMLGEAERELLQRP